MSGISVLRVERVARKRKIRFEIFNDHDNHETRFRIKNLNSFEIKIVRERNFSLDIP